MIVLSSATPPPAEQQRRIYRRRRSTPVALRRAIQLAIDRARRHGDPVSWDIVEELSAAASHIPPALTPIEEWCDLNPWDEECRVYDV